MKFKEYDKVKILVKKDGYPIDMVTYEKNKLNLF